MWNRRNQILAVILALQVVVAVVVFWPGAAVSQTTGAPLLANFKAADVVDVVVTDRDGNTVEMAKSGEDWVLPKRDNFPVVSSRVTDLLSKLEKVNTNRLITKTEASHKQLQVAANDFNRKVEVKLKDNTAHTVYIGTSGGGSASHVRADDQLEVYLTGDVLSFDVNALESNWVETLFFTVPQTATVGITLQNAQGTFEFDRPNGDSEWAMKGLAADEILVQNNVLGVVNQVTSLHMESPLGKTKQDTYGMDKPQAVVTLKTTDNGQEKTYTLTFGAKLEEEKQSASGDKLYYYVAGSSESPYYVRISDYIGDALVQKKRGDFLPAPPTPTPAAGVTPTTPGG
jgi:hypothetical protein